MLTTAPTHEHGLATKTDFLGLRSHMDKRFSEYDDRFIRIDERFDRLEVRMDLFDEKLMELGGLMISGLERVEEKFEKRFTKIDTNMLLIMKHLGIEPVV
jgi:hypothetical protein